MLKTNQCIGLQALLTQVHSDNQSGQFYDFIQNKMLFGSRYNVYSPVPRMPIASQNTKPAGVLTIISQPAVVQKTVRKSSSKAN